MIVCKFGGSSVASKPLAQRIKDIVLNNKNRKVIVVSALGKSEEYDYKITDKLFELYHAIDCGQEYLSLLDDIFFRYEKLSFALGVEIDWGLQKEKLLKNIEDKKFTKGYLVSRGEYYSAMMYAKYLGFKFLDASKYIIFKKCGEIDKKITKNRLKSLNFDKGVVIGGFYGAKPNGDVCVFDRGGSDITGAIICKALNCEIYENYTDVDGVFDKNPNLFLNAEPIPLLDYKTAIAMADGGNEVVHKLALSEMRECNSILIVKSTIAPNKLGSIVTQNFIVYDKLYICKATRFAIIFNDITKKSLDEFSKVCEFDKVINYLGKYIVLVKNIYYTQEKIKQKYNCVSICETSVFTLFSNFEINKNNLKIIKKIQKNVKKYNIYCDFLLKNNNFTIICDKKNENVIINQINKYFK